MSWCATPEGTSCTRPCSLAPRASRSSSSLLLFFFPSHFFHSTRYACFLSQSVCSLTMGGSSSKLPALQLVEAVDIPRFMGTWYVIAVKPTYFEVGGCNAREIYTWNDAAQRVDVDFTMRKGSVEGKLSSMPQKGFGVEGRGGAEWKLQPVWPLKVPFLIIELADDYSHTVIGFPSRQYCWIMARSPTMSDALYEELRNDLVDKARRDRRACRYSCHCCSLRCGDKDSSHFGNQDTGTRVARRCTWFSRRCSTGTRSTMRPARSARRSNAWRTSGTTSRRR